MWNNASALPYAPNGIAILVSIVQVMLPDTLRGRMFHTTTIIHCDPTHKKLIHFGGLDEWPEDGDVNKTHPVAETTIVELGEWSAPHYCTFSTHYYGNHSKHSNQVIVALGMRLNFLL